MRSREYQNEAKPFLESLYCLSKMNRLTIMYDAPSLQQSDEYKAVAVINSSAYTLNAIILDRIMKMMNIKVVHLGSCHPGMDYVVVDDIVLPFLNSLKNFKQARFLSLQGVARIYKLPDSIYSLINLKILDLQACQDLMYLPKGIESLRNLIHLDMSECYQPEYIPKGIGKLTQLRLLKGFVINPKEGLFKKSSCPFSELSNPVQLQKLSIRTRRMDFPSNQDVITLCKFKQLNKLKVAWVHSKQTRADGNLNNNVAHRFLPELPTNLKKLELQAASDISISLMLGLFANRSTKSLEKLYISGGRIGTIDTNNYCFLHVEVLRFRFLPELHINWFELKPSFPNLTRLEIFRCPDLIFFPVNEFGVWEESELL